MIGFLSLNFSDAPPFHDLGNMSAIGVVAAWILSMTFLPALAAILPARTRVDRSGDTPRIEKLGNFVIANRNRLLVGVGLASVVVIASAANSEAQRFAIIRRWWAASPPRRRLLRGVAGMAISP